MIPTYRNCATCGQYTPKKHRKDLENNGWTEVEIRIYHANVKIDSYRGYICKECLDKLHNNQDSTE